MSKSYFGFTFSEETTNKLLNGDEKLKLGPGGVRNLDGTLFELAKPVLIDLDKELKNDHWSLEKHLRRINTNLDYVMENNIANNEKIWMTYLEVYRSFEMTSRSFESVFKKLDDLKEDIERIHYSIRKYAFNEKYKNTNQCIMNARSDFALMSKKNFQFEYHSRDIEMSINDISAHLYSLYSGLQINVIEEPLLLVCIMELLKPYFFVMKKYSVLYYYENGELPVNFEQWLKTLRTICTSKLIKTNMQYNLRIHEKCNLEEVYSISRKIRLCFKNLIEDIEFTHQFILCHEKEQFFSLDEQLQSKFTSKEYKMINGHLCIELD